MVNRGLDQADAYLAFLKRDSLRLGSTYSTARPVPTRPGYFFTTIRKRARGHGHVVVFRISEDRIEILHYYHTAQDWQNYYT